ncbi:carboxymuconolactone decarboxylase family protein [Devosia sp. A449]
MEETARQQLKDDVLRLRGYWHKFHDGLMDMAPDYLAAYLAFQNAPAVSANIEPKVCEFIYIAADGAVSHLYASGAARHIEMALDKGATEAEVLEVIQLTTLSSHMTMEAGMSALVGQMTAAGLAPDVTLTAEQQARKQSFEALTGYWPEGGDALFTYAPGFIDAFLRYAEIPYRDGPLPRKVKEFIRIAVCASPVGPAPKGLNRHIALALKHGATPQEIADVLQLTSAIAIHTCTTTIPPLMDAAAARRA